jgi:hypothetical protein
MVLAAVLQQCPVNTACMLGSAAAELAMQQDGLLLCRSLGGAGTGCCVVRHCGMRMQQQLINRV